MKAKNLPITLPTRLRRTRRLLTSWRLHLAALAVAALAGLAVCTPAQAQTDNFNSGSLGPNWATSISANFPGTISFVPDPFGGQAIRLVATNCTIPPPPPPQDESAYTARVLAWRTDRLYTNFYVAVDVLGWDTSLERNTNGPLIGLMARARNVGRDPSVPVGWPDCMILFLNYNRFGGPGGGTRGVIDLGHLKDGGTASIFNTLGVQGDCTLQLGHSYRMVFTGTNMLDYLGSPSSVYWGRVYDLQDLTHPLAEITCPDPNPFIDLTALWETPGYSGIASVADGINRDNNDNFLNYKTTDVTFDNFVAAEYPPASVSFPGTTNGEAGLPQVINKTPASWSNFYAPAGGISFTATTLGGGNVTSVKLFLNGVDVSSGLTIGPLSNSRTVSLPGSGLAANMVYNARIELANALGQTTTNIWTFDTFSDAFLASTNLCKIIECEDFDFNGGQFIDNPLASGWTTNDTFYNDANTAPYQWPGATNQDSTTPPYTSYVNKGTTNDLGVDYWDVEGHNYLKTWYEADFRPLYLTNNPTPPDSETPGRSPGTTQGAYYSVVDYMGWWFPGNIGENRLRVFDTQRQKYYTLNSDHSIQEYLLERLEGGEWYNYTRTFAATNYYNVYLRHGSEYNLQLSLSKVGPGPTLTKLGEFYTTHAMVTWNYCYTPLVDGAGKPVVVNFSGPTKLRLLMDFLQEERTKYGLMLNYMAFVPALVVESSSQAQTGYTFDNTASIEPITRTITLPQNGTARYYRLRWPGTTVTIKSITVTGGNVVLTYQ